MKDVELLRLVTVHPALIHFALGTLPVIVLSYAVASFRRSERWAFVGDVSTWVTAALAIVAAAFGLASLLTLRWPGGVERWRNLHVGFGVAFVVGLAALAVSRARRSGGSRPAVGYRTLVAAVGVGLLAMVTAWIGGEQLVFRAGMGVTAAGDGALAPPLLPASASAGEPTGTKDAMHRVRASWGALVTTTASMLVDRPRDEGFATIAREAAAVERASGWLAREGSKRFAPDTDMSHAGVGGGPPATDAVGETPKEAFERWSEELGETAKSVREAAEERKIEGVAKTVGRLQSVCVGCHADLRWRHAQQ